MKMRSQKWHNVWACMALSVCIAACSGDEVDTNNTTGDNQGNATKCDMGEEYNPILGRCVTTPKGNNDPMDLGTREDMPVIDRDMGSMSPDQGDTQPDVDMMPDQSTGMDQGEPDQGIMQDMTPDMTPDMQVTPDMPEDTCGVGTILGVACVPSGDALPNAVVTVTGIDCSTGQPFTKTTTASATGRYELTDIPSGRVEVTLESGSFNRTFPVTLGNGEMLDLTQAASKVCIEGNSVSIAVLSGEYDDVEGILDELQLSYEIKGNDGKVFTPGFLGPGTPADAAGLRQARDFLLNPTEMARYDVIFINCGNLWDALNSVYSGDVNTIITNLYNYYQSGKSLYASDWAHMFIERAFPSVLDFFPAGGSDGSANDARQGFAPQNVTATVVSPALQGVLGSNTVVIDFPHNPPQIYNDHWVMMASANPGATVHLSGSVKQCATAQCSTAGATLPDSPLLVTFKSATHGGSLAFTSFHNHASGTPVSPEISKILKFLIFQL